MGSLFYNIVQSRTQIVAFVLLHWRQIQSATTSIPSLDGVQNVDLRSWRSTVSTVGLYPIWIRHVDLGG
jgi:hypothetical protein